MLSVSLQFPFQFVAGTLKWAAFAPLARGGVPCLNNKSLSALDYYCFELLPFLLLFLQCSARCPIEPQNPKKDFWGVLRK